MQISVSQIATIGRDDAPSQLTRTDRTNVATIMANLQGRALGAVTADIKRALRSEPVPKGYAFDFKGDTSMMSDSFGSLSWALIASLVLVYLILLVLYDSFLTPAIRMLSLPAGIIGGLAALALTGKAINILCFIGIILLDGLASKNGTLLIDYTNTLMKRGLRLREALIESGSTRLRPIVMTSVTMIVGMLPLAISTGSSSEIKSGMAISAHRRPRDLDDHLPDPPPRRLYAHRRGAQARARAARSASRPALEARSGRLRLGRRRCRVPDGRRRQRAGGSARSAEVPLPTAPGALR